MFLFFLFQQYNQTFMFGRKKNSSMLTMKLIEFNVGFVKLRPSRQRETPISDRQLVDQYIDWQFKI